MARVLLLATLLAMDLCPEKRHQRGVFFRQYGIIKKKKKKILKTLLAMDPCPKSIERVCFSDMYVSKPNQNICLLGRAVNFGYFCARVPLLIFRREPGTQNLFLQIVSLFCCMLQALLATASVYVLYSTRLCYLSQLAPIWRIVHSELDTPHTSARHHEGFCI